MSALLDWFPHPNARGHGAPPVSLHPEAVPGEPSLMRWVVPAGTFTASGRVLRGPAAFGGMLASGAVVATVEPGGGALLLQLREDASWREAGSRVRTALQAALAERERWEIDTSPAPDLNDRLRSAASDVLAGPFADYARSHGGNVKLVDVRDGVVTVHFNGACRGCPAAGLTLHARLEREMRERCPDMVSIRRQ